MTQAIKALDTADTTLVMRLEDTSDSERALVSLCKKWVLTPEDETRQSWLVEFKDYGLNIKLYEGASLSHSLQLLKHAAGAKEIAVLDYAGSES